MLFLTTTAYAATNQFRGNVGAMIVDADPIVKLVLLVLFLFSIISWAIIIQKWLQISRARKKATDVFDALDTADTMSEMLGKVKLSGDSVFSRLFYEGKDELTRISSKVQSVPMSMLNNVEGRIVNSSSQEVMHLSKGLGFLASISNASPFIGLFGTVWGIMDSFREIGIMGSANLATVAPGISEALIATAAGLFVAIPAVLFYNYFTNQMNQLTSRMDQFRIEFMNWIRRGLLHADT